MSSRLTPTPRLRRGYFPKLYAARSGSASRRWTSKSLRSCGPSSRSFRLSSSTAAFPTTRCRSTCTTTCKRVVESASLSSGSSWGSCQRRRCFCTPPSYIGTSTTVSRSPPSTAPLTTSRERSLSGLLRRWPTTGARVMQTRTRPYSLRCSSSWATALTASSSKRWSGRTKPCTHEMRTRLTNISARPGSKISKRSATRTRSSFARTSSPSNAPSKWVSWLISLPSFACSSSTTSSSTTTSTGETLNSSRWTRTACTSPFPTTSSRTRSSRGTRPSSRLTRKSGSEFNNPLYIRQQGLQLPDNPRHGVRHGIQAQGVTVEQHVAQIFLARGFDNFVLRFRCVCEKPVQKLSKHSKLAEAGWRVHGPYICVSYKLVIECIGPGCDGFPRQPPEGVGVKFV